MNQSSKRKWLRTAGILTFAVGFPFILLKELNSYILFGIIIMVLGIALLIASNFYRN